MTVLNLARRFGSASNGARLVAFTLAVSVGVGCDAGEGSEEQALEISTDADVEELGSGDRDPVEDATLFTAAKSMAPVYAGCDPQPAKPDLNANIFLYYGAYGGGTGETTDPSLLLAKGGGEQVLLQRGNTPNCDGPRGSFRAWRRAGGEVGYLALRSEFEGLIDANPALPEVKRIELATAKIATRLKSGFAYYVIDELNPYVTETKARAKECAAIRKLHNDDWLQAKKDPCAAAPNTTWMNGHKYARAFAGVLAGLERAGLGRRVILYSNSYNMPGRFSQFRQVLQACAKGCRTFASEVYVAAWDVLKARPDRPGHCSHNVDCFQSLAAEAERVAPGINARTITVIATHDQYTHKSGLALCGSETRSGALASEYAALRNGQCTDQQHGVGFYSLTRSGRSETTSSITYDVSWQMRQASCIVAQNKEWSPHGTAAQCLSAQPKPM